MSIPIFIKQRDAMDCGPSCLGMVCRFYGKTINIQTLRDKTEIGKEGVNLLGINTAAESIGFRTQGVKLTFQQLIKEAPLPCILHWDQEHFVVLLKCKKPFFEKEESLIVADPGKGIIKLSKKDFCEKWNSSKIDGETYGIALLLEPTHNFHNQENEKNHRYGWRLLLKYFTQQRRFLIQLLVGMLLGSLLQLIMPLLTQSIVDTGINQQNLSFIYIVLAAQFMLFFSRTIVDFIRSRILLFISTKINLTILSDFWIKMMRLPFHFFDTKQTGDIMQRVGDHKRIERFLTGSALNTFFSLFNLIIFSFVILQYNLYVFGIFIIGSILYFLWIKLFLRYRRNLDYKRFAVASSENTATMQLIYGMQEIKLNGAEQLKRWEWEGIQASLFKLNFKSLSLNQYQQAGAFFINEGKNILITFFVATAVLNGQLTLGAMLAIQYIIGQLNSPIEQLIGFIQQAQDAQISLERLNEIHQMKDEEPQENDLQKRLPQDLSITINSLSFTYLGAGNEPVLKNIDLYIPQGKTTAIVGMSGSGKTTLLKLLLRFYESYKGEIKVGESNLKYISPRYWRTHCGSVMQDGYIFNDSIAKNIAVCEDRPNYDRLIYACKVANIISFIESLPLGFNTKIGAEGNGISAGQRQRILIARVIYRNPEYIFLDEATNSLDANSELIILENLKNFFRTKTVLVVAHRLSTVKNADNIVVLEGGEIIESGSHELLTLKKGKYFELVKNQLELGN